jgi:non-heme chloroperoxidase
VAGRLDHRGYRPPSALRVASIALRNPGNRNRAIGLTEEQFRYRFGDTLTEEESSELYHRWTIPSPGKPLFEAAVAGFSPGSPAKVDTKNSDRGPLLVTAGGKDQTVPLPSRGRRASSTTSRARSPT